VLAPQQLICLSDNNNIRAAHWADHQRKAEWLDNLLKYTTPLVMRLHTYIPDTGNPPSRNDPPKNSLAPT